MGYRVARKVVGHVRLDRVPVRDRSAGGCWPLGQERVADLNAVVFLAWVEIL